MLIEIGGLRLLTDPTFDQPGHFGQPGALESDKLAGPAIPADELGRIDAVLLSHDQHFDNLDVAGRAFLDVVPVTLTTPEGAKRIGGTARGLGAFESTEVTRADGGTLTVTGVPARHGPEGADAVLGPVTGFWLSADDVPAIYITGDNASLDYVSLIAERFGPADLIVQFVGGVRNPRAFDGQLLTMNGLSARISATLLDARVVAVAHAEGWSHFATGREDVVSAFATADMSDRLLDTPPGEPVAF